jgi:single-strand DNA-binding protein
LSQKSFTRWREAAFIGRVGTEPELKTSQAGKPWTAINVAVGKDEDTQWVRVAAFAETAERPIGRVVKGDRVYVEGDLRLNQWTDREGKPGSGLSVAARKVEKLGEIGRNRPPNPNGSCKATPADGQRPASPSATSAQRPVADPRDRQRPVDDAIPFERRGGVRSHDEAG